MRKLLTLSLVLAAAAAPAFGSLTLTLSPASLPTYSYFYTCASGVENCNDPGFAVNYHGDFGMANVYPIQCHICPPTNTGLGITASNKLGEVIGYFPEYGVGYGFGGQVYQIDTSDDDGAVDINNNGIWLISSVFGWGGFVIGSGPAPGLSGGSLHSSFTTNQVAVLMGLPLNSVSSARALGINDSNQILFEYDVYNSYGGVSRGQGILSPSPIPEPSALILLSTVVCACVVAIRKKLRSQATTTR